MNKPKIAFIDDEKRILRSLKMHFRQSHDVFITTEPQELFDYVQENNVDVVVSDQRMPDMQGNEVLDKVKQISPNSIRILLTGYADLNAVIDSVNEGEIYRYITKPWDNDELKRIVNKATDIAQQTQSITPHIEDVPEADYSHIDKNLLVLNDDQDTFEQIKNQFEPQYKVYWADSLDKASSLLSKKDFGVAITDVNLDGENITPIIYALKNLQPNLMMIMLTEFKDAHKIIDLINKGQIYRYLPRPTNLSLLSISLDRAFAHHAKMVQQPQLAVRHHVEEVSTEEAISFASKLKGFFSKFNQWRSLFS